MVSSIYTYIVIHIHTYNRHAHLYSQSYKLSYIVKVFKLGYLAIYFLATQMFFSFYFQYILEMMEAFNFRPQILGVLFTNHWQNLCAPLQRLAKPMHPFHMFVKPCIFIIWPYWSYFSFC